MIVEKPLVSVISAYYNRGNFVAQSVQSLIEQSLENIEIIIIDDGSTDSTADELRKFTNPKFNAVFQNNIGLTPSFNKAIGMARGNYIAIHGSGDISLPDRLAKQAAYLNANPAVGVVGCLIESKGKVWGQGGERGSLITRALKSNPFSHGEVMFRRDIFNKVGGYREIFRYAQDRDLWLRMGRHCEYAILPDLLYKRYYIPGGVAMDPDKVYLQKKLAHFAVVCAQSADSEGRDDLERLGPSAFALMAPSRSVSHDLAKAGLRAFRDGRFATGQSLIAYAYLEKPTPLAKIARMLSLIVMNLPSLQHPIKRLMQILTGVSENGMHQEQHVSQIGVNNG